MKLYMHISMDCNVGIGSPIAFTNACDIWSLTANQCCHGHAIYLREPFLETCSINSCLIWTSSFVVCLTLRVRDYICIFIST